MPELGLFSQETANRLGEAIANLRSRLAIVEGQQDRLTGNLRRDDMYIAMPLADIAAATIGPTSIMPVSGDAKIYHYSGSMFVQLYTTKVYNFLDFKALADRPIPVHREWTTGRFMAFPFCCPPDEPDVPTHPIGLYKNYSSQWSGPEPEDETLLGFTETNMAAGFGSWLVSDYSFPRLTDFVANMFMVPVRPVTERRLRGVQSSFPVQVSPTITEVKVTLSGIWPNLSAPTHPEFRAATGTVSLVPVTFTTGNYFWELDITGYINALVGPVNAWHLVKLEASISGEQCFFQSDLYMLDELDNVVDVAAV
jgi:hypothetical protein